ELTVEFVRALAGSRRADAENVHERPAGVADGFEDLAGISAAVVFDDDAGARTEVRFQPGFGAPRIAGGDGDAGFVQTPSERSLFDDELDFETGQQDLIEHPDDEFVLTDCQTAQASTNQRLYAAGCAELCSGARRTIGSTVARNRNIRVRAEQGRRA